MKPAESISLDFSDGKLILRQGHVILFSGTIAQPETIAIVLKNIPLVSGSSTTETINGISKTTWILSLNPPEVGRSSQHQHHFF